MKQGTNQKTVAELLDLRSKRVNLAEMYEEFGWLVAGGHQRKLIAGIDRDIGKMNDGVRGGSVSGDLSRTGVIQYFTMNPGRVCSVGEVADALGAGCNDGLVKLLDGLSAIGVLDEVEPRRWRWLRG